MYKLAALSPPSGTYQVIIAGKVRTNLFRVRVDCSRRAGLTFTAPHFDRSFAVQGS